jgi:O-antigen/teichoic acid export membrane protein
MSRAIRNTIVAFGQHVLGAVSGALGIFFIARRMPEAQHNLGILGFALSFVGLFVAVQRTFDSAHVKRLSEGQPSDVCNATYAVLKILATTALVGIVLAALFVWTEVLGRGFQSDLHVTLIQIVIVYHLLNAVGEAMRQTYRGHENILYGQIALSIEHVIKGAATVYVAFYGLEPFVAGARNAFGLGIAYVIGASGLGVFALAMLSRQSYGRPSWSMAKSYATFALPLLLTNVFFLTSDEVAQVLLQLFWNAREVGIFFAPQRYTKFLPSIANALGTALFPVFSNLHGRGETAPNVVGKAIRGMSLVLLPMVAVSVALPKAIVHVLLSDRFLASAPVLAILAVGGYIKSLRLTIETKLTGTNRPKEVLKAGAASSFGNVLFVTVLVAPSLFGIPLAGLGAVGAALGVAGSFLVGFLWAYRSASRKAGVTFPPIRKHAILFAASVAVLWGVGQVVPQTAFRIYHLLGAGVLSMAVFYGLGWVIGEIDDHDVEVLRQLVDPDRWVDFFADPGRDDDEE